MVELELTQTRKETSSSIKEFSQDISMCQPQSDTMCYVLAAKAHVLVCATLLKDSLGRRCKFPHHGKVWWGQNRILYAQTIFYPEEGNNINTTSYRKISLRIIAFTKLYRSLCTVLRRGEAKLWASLETLLLAYKTLNGLSTTIYGIPITHFTSTENSDVLLPSRFRVTSCDRSETARAFAHHDHHNNLSLTYSRHMSKYPGTEK